MTTPMPRRVTTILLALTTALALPGCGVTATDLPLPGGGIDGDTYRLTAVFAEALNLPTKAHVKLDGVTVGQVTDIVPRDYTARVSFVVSEAVTLPQGTAAELRQATPLGDVFVALHPPKRTKSGPTLRDGDVLGLKATSAAATVEDLLGALSALVNGGGLNQLGTIVRESNAALDGRGEEFKHLLTELTTTLSTLNRRTRDIDRILKATKSVSTTLGRRQATLDAAFSDFTPALKVLNEQTGQFSRALNALSQAANSGDNVLTRGGDDLAATLRDLEPILDGFADLKGRLRPTLRLMLDVGQILERATEGESITADMQVAGVTNIPGVGGQPPSTEDATRAASTVLASLEKLVNELERR